VAGVVHQCKLTVTIAFSPSFFRVQFEYEPIEILIEQEAAAGGGHTRESRSSACLHTKQNERQEGLHVLL